MTEYVKETILAIIPSASPDVTGYRLYVVPEGEEIIRDADGHVPNAEVHDLPQTSRDPNDGRLRWDLGSLPNMTTNDGVYNLGVAAVDSAGNESSFLLIPDVALDFIAPNAPSGGIIERP